MPQTKNPSKPGFSLRKLLLLLLTASVLAISGFLTKKIAENIRWNNWVVQSEKIKINMSKAEVISIMGEPSERASEGRTEKDKWDAFFYEVPQFTLICAWGCSERTVFIRFNPDKVDLVEVRPYFQIKFNSEDWKQSTSERRWSMVDDLIQSKIILNLSKENVVGILGPPNTISSDSWTYYAGPERGFGVDTQVLIFDFREGIISNVYITHE